MKLGKDSNKWAGGGAVTLAQVAQRAGVHRMTVSRALQGSEKVAPATRENIARIAKELNYIPNVTARALAMGKTGTVAIVINPVSEHYYAQLLYLLESELTASNYKMVFLRGRDTNHDMYSFVNANGVDGVIAIDAFFNISELVQSQETFIPPCVYAGVPNPNWPSPIDTIHIDLTKGIQEALETMLKSGCSRIAYLVANEEMASPVDSRPRVYNATLKAAGLPREIINTDVGSNTYVHELIRQRLVEYIRANGHPDGMLCQNDEMAMAAYRALRDLRLRLPEDVQIVGCDGLAYMDCFDPQLSTIVQPAEEMCALAWKFLQKRMNDPAAPRQQATLDAHLRVRDSLKTP